MTAASWFKNCVYHTY